MIKHVLTVLLPLCLSACIVAPAGPPPPPYPGMASEYYPDYGYYYGAPYPAYYGGTIGFYDWGYWHGGHHHDGGHWGHFHGRHWR